MAVKKEVMRSGWQEVAGIILIALGVLCLLGLLSYEWRDISALNTPPNDPPVNFIGPVGAWFAYGLFALLGIAGYLFPAGLLYLGLAAFLKPEGGTGRRAACLVVLLISVSMFFELSPDGWQSARENLNIGFAGGILGEIITQRFLVSLIGGIGTGILSTALLLVSLIMLLEVHPAVLWMKLRESIQVLTARLAEWRRSRMDQKALLEDEEKELAKRRRQLEESMKVPSKPSRARAAAKPEPEPEPEDEEQEANEDDVDEDQPPPLPVVKPKLPFFDRKPKVKPKPPEPAPVLVPPTPDPISGYLLPSIQLLDVLPPAASREITSDMQNTGEILKDTLAEFGIEVEVTNVEKGPVVTRYELLPAAGVRLEKITGLSNNIALAMKAESIRVQAPIPGKGVVGIEVPNSTTTTVYLREIMESNLWQSGKAGLPLALGKDVGGHVLVADLAEMPHMLIAGATGAGKTVCMNSILTGLLMARTPDQMKLMLVDPKIVEFSNYNTLPHLLVPVITDPKKVSHGLRWAISEMERRYKLFAKAGVRNIKSFNTRPLVKQEELFGSDAAPPPPAEDKIPDRIPYIVIVIDELADLMLAAQAEIENYIARLAQLSRATGIHMIIATQRPSVNVITGTIKANFPSRISFQVAQKVDSRTILDAAGADKLLGKGDMLFLSPGSGKLIRAQGTYTSDREIHSVVDFIKAQGHQPVFETAIKEKIESTTTELPEMSENDELLDQAIEIIRQTKRASTSSLQRRLRIGYTRAARIMDILEEKGIVGPAQGSDPREIMVDLDGEVPTHSDQENN